MLAEIDTIICNRILDNEIKVSIVRYNFKSYLGVYLTKNESFFWDNSIYIYGIKLKFIVLGKISKNIYIVSKTQNDNPSKNINMVSIRALMSLYSFKKDYIPRCIIPSSFTFKLKNRFCHPTNFNVSNCFLVILE